MVLNECGEASCVGLSCSLDEAHVQRKRGFTLVAMPQNSRNLMKVIIDTHRHDVVERVGAESCGRGRGTADKERVKCWISSKVWRGNSTRIQANVVVLDLQAPVVGEHLLHTRADKPARRPCMRRIRRGGEASGVSAG